jgi:preprotein translocase subunit YajC
MGGFEVLIPITFFVLIGVLLYYGITSRHKERMTMLEKGFSAEQMRSLAHREFRGYSPLSSLKWGIIIVAIGLAIIVGNFLRAIYNVDESIVVGVVFLFAGLALVIFYFIASKKMQEPETPAEK